MLHIGSAVCATGVVIALGVAVAGLWALPVFCVPLLLTQLSFRRYAAVRTTYTQTIAFLARATEIAGYTPHGHARRVAELSCAVGRELGLSGPELTVLEYAALMHDIGQLSLVDPVPDGATALLPVVEQRRIALLGGAVVRQTGVPRPSRGWWSGRRIRTGNSRFPPGSSAPSMRTTTWSGNVPQRAARSARWSGCGSVRRTTISRRWLNPWRVSCPGAVRPQVGRGNPWVMSGRRTGHGWMPRRGCPGALTRATGRRES